MEGGGQQREKTLILLIAFLTFLVAGQIIGFEYYYSNVVIQSQTAQDKMLLRNKNISGDGRSRVDTTTTTKTTTTTTKRSKDDEEKNVITAVLDKPSLPKLRPTKVVHEEVKNHTDNGQEVVDTGEGLRSPEEVLVAAGVFVTDEMRSMLRPKDDTLQMYGSKPVFYGLERCEEFKSNTDLADAFIGIAGMVRLFFILCIK